MNMLIFSPYLMIVLNSFNCCHSQIFAHPITTKQLYSPSLGRCDPYKFSVGTRCQCRGIARGGQRGRSPGWWASCRIWTALRRAARRWRRGLWKTSPRFQILCAVQSLAGTTWICYVISLIKFYNFFYEIWHLKCTPDFGHGRLEPAPVGHRSWQIVVFTKLQWAGVHQNGDNWRCWSVPQKVCHMESVSIVEANMSQMVLHQAWK